MRAMLMKLDFSLADMLVQLEFIPAAMQLDALRSKMWPVLMKPDFILAVVLMQLDFVLAAMQPDSM